MFIVVVLITFLLPQQKHDKDNLKEKVFNLGTHDSMKLDSMTTMLGRMAAGRQAGIMLEQ